MARKNPFGKTLAKAMSEGATFDDDDEDLVTEPRRASGPTVSRAIDALKEDDRHATRMIPPSQVRLSRISDRIDPEQSLDTLIESIRSEGQKVPILVRRLADGDLEVVYGRRRLLACRAIGCEVRATVMEMDDEQALIAQGVENNERLNTSFIERALFAHRIEQAGFGGGVIQKVMGIDESLVRKMRSIAALIPEPLITRIGPAPDAGRRQWEELKRVCQEIGEARALALAEEVDTSLASSERLAQILSVVKPKPPAPKSSGTELVTGHLAAKRSGANLTFKVKKKADQEFLSYLEERVPDLYSEWKDR